MNGYKILKCFRKEKRVSGELPCPATSLISLIVGDKTDFFFSTGIVKLIHNCELTFRILSSFFAFVY